MYGIDDTRPFDILTFTIVRPRDIALRQDQDEE